MFTGLKRRFIGLIILTCIVTGTGGVIAFFLVMDNTVRDLRKAYATQYTLLEKGRILAPIQREVALTMKMVDSPVLKAWALDENNPILKAQALKELESYRRHFQDQSWFFIIDPSKHFYFNNAKNEYEGKENRYTLKKENPDDQWYFATLQTVPDFDLNVDYDREVKETKLWINAVIRQGDRKLGIAGTGLTLDRFLKQIVEKGHQDATTILIDRQGAVQAHPDESFIDHDSLAKKEDERSTIFRLLRTSEEAKRMRDFLDERVQSPDSVAVTNFDVGGTSYICAAAYIPEIQWYVLTLLSRRGFINVGDFTPVALLLIASLVIFVLVITFLLNRFVLNPITRLTRSTKEMARGRYESVPQEQEGNEIGELIRSFNQMAKQVRDHTDHLEQTVTARTADLSRTNMALTEKNHQIEQSIQYAEMIQRSVLSKPEDISKELSDFFLIWRPKDVVGGDFYYFRKTGAGFFLGLGDCTGHGVSGAFMNMTAMAALNHIIGSRPNMGPAAVLSALNQTLRETLQQDRFGELFDNGLDMGLCFVPDRSKEICFAGARIDLLYWVESDFQVLKGDRASIGYRSSEPHFKFRDQFLTVEEGMGCYLHTDGFIHQSGGLRGFPLGRIRMMEHLKVIALESMDEQANELEAVLENWRSGVPQRDDITFLGFRLGNRLGCVKTESM